MKSAPNRICPPGKFYRCSVLAKLPSCYTRSTEETFSLFHFLQDKGGSLAASFTPLLGPLDEAAKGRVFHLLDGDVPAGSSAQKEYFEPKPTSMSEKDQNWLRQNAAGLKKSLVY